MVTTQWLGLSGDWSTPADWSTGRVPGPSDDAVIAAPGGYTVTVTTPESVGSVALNDPGATLEISGSTLVVSGSLNVQSGTLKIASTPLGNGVLAVGGGLSVQPGGTLFLGGMIEGGSLAIAPGGAFLTSGGGGPPFFPIFGAPTLQDVTVLGGLTLNGDAVVLSGNTTIENGAGTGPGAITLNGNSYLSLSEDYTFHDLTLNGGSVVGAHTTATVAKGGLVQGYGSFIFGDLTPCPYRTRG